MGYIKFKNKKTVSKVIVSEESPHVIRITGDNITVNTDGFRLYLDEGCKYPLDNGEYAAYTTLYRKGDGWYELSDNGSVYVEPVAPVQPEPTEEELEEMARQEQIRQVTAQINDLKEQIAASDYKVIKTYEYTLLGEQTEYDMEAVHAERQALRDQINSLETKLADLTAE
jgi:polyhydroxyalkanoate synthesis regulator phasin